MFLIRSEALREERGRRYSIDFRARAATFEEILCAWQSDDGFRVAFSSALADAPYAAFRWETPAVTAATASRPFEFVLLDCPGLARSADPEAFAEHFGGAVAGVAVFANLGRDAVLVVPCPAADPSAYGHLAAFVRLAEDQRHALWKSVGLAMTRRVGAAPVWLSTAGAGVAWLHVRLDDRPKYYGFGPYRQSPSA